MSPSPRTDLPRLALVPYRNQRLLGTTISAATTTTAETTTTTQAQESSTLYDRSWLAGTLPVPTATAATLLGRVKLLTALWRLCGCCRATDSTSNSTSTATDWATMTAFGCTTNKCAHCLAVNEWSTRHLSKQWMRLSTATATDADTDTDIVGNSCTVQFLPSLYPVETLVHVNGVPVGTNSWDFFRSINNEETKDGTIRVTLHVGDVLTVLPPPTSNSNNNATTTTNEDTSSSTATSWKPLELQLVRLESYPLDDALVRAVTTTATTTEEEAQPTVTTAVRKDEPHTSEDQSVVGGDVVSSRSADDAAQQLQLLLEQQQQSSIDDDMGRESLQSQHSLTTEAQHALAAAYKVLQDAMSCKSETSSLQGSEQESQSQFHNVATRASTVPIPKSFRTCSAASTGTTPLSPDTTVDSRQQESQLSSPGWSSQPEQPPTLPLLPTANTSFNDNTTRHGLGEEADPTDDESGVDNVAAADATLENSSVVQEQADNDHDNTPNAKAVADWTEDANAGHNDDDNTIAPLHTLRGEHETALMASTNPSSPAGAATSLSRNLSSTDRFVVPLEQPRGPYSFNVHTAPWIREQQIAPLKERQVETLEPTTAAKTDGNNSSSIFTPVLYFVPRGLDMVPQQLEGNDALKLRGLKPHSIKRGAVVLDSFDKDCPPWPTYLVISGNALVSSASVVDELGFDDEESLAIFLDEHNIECVNQRWAANGRASSLNPPPFKAPGMNDISHKITSKIIKKRESPQAKSRNVRHRSDDGVDTTNALSNNVVAPPAPPGVRNLALSEAFRKLSKLHQEAPLNEDDTWKSYCFNVTSGRLRHLPFDITTDPSVLARVRKVKGIGSSQMLMIQEFLHTKSLLRIQEFETDPRRVAMKRMMYIWGIGRVKATLLLEAGCKTIEDVRQAVQTGRVSLDRNQLIGLDYYDDFLEEMSRSEVEKIASIVEEFFVARFPSVEITIMGSYRRGKQKCGDVDILITHPDYMDFVPPRALGKVVDELLQERHMAHHLTFISGMEQENTNESGGNSKQKKDKYSGSSYMGVFHSPCVTGRYRRVDIKFYPYRERIFASLYFTGNGHFNRSMRLWAMRKFNYSMNDHGLFLLNTKERVMESNSEKEVFDRLDMLWKEPHERDCFDAVISKRNGETAAQLEEMSNHELNSEGQEHSWIN